MQFAGKNNRMACENTRHMQAKITANAGKNTHTIAGKNARNCSQKYLQLQAICSHTVGKFTCNIQVS